MPVRHSTNWTKPRTVNQGSLYAALLWTERTHILGNTQNLELIVQKKKTNLNSGQILRKWSHCFFHFRERRARFSKRIFLQLIFSASSPVLFFNSYIISCSEVAASLWLAFCDRSQPPTMEIVLLIKFETHFTKKENCSQLGSNSQKMKSLLLSFLRKKSSLLKNNLPTVNIFRFITLAYFSTDIFSAILKLQLVSDMPFAVDCNPKDGNWYTHQNVKLTGQTSQLRSNSQKIKSLPLSFPRKKSLPLKKENETNVL